MKCTFKLCSALGVLLTWSLSASAMKLPSNFLRDLVFQTEFQLLLREFAISQGSAQSEYHLLSQLMEDERELNSVHRWLSRIPDLIDLEIGLIEGRVPHQPFPIVHFSQDWLMGRGAIASQREARIFYSKDLLHILSSIPDAKIKKSLAFAQVKLNYHLVASIAGSIQRNRVRSRCSKIFDWWRGDFVELFLEELKKDSERYTKEYSNISEFPSDDAIDELRMTCNRTNEDGAAEEQDFEKKSEERPDHEFAESDFSDDTEFLLSPAQLEAGLRRRKL